MLKKFVVEDSIDGMEKSLEALQDSMNRGYTVAFDLRNLSSESKGKVILLHDQKTEQILQQTARKSNCEGIGSEANSELGSDTISKG